MQKRWYSYGWTGILLAGLFSCNINGTNWDLDVTGPVMETTLDFSKMVGQENLDVAPDSALTLHIQDTVYTFQLDTLSDLPLEDVLYTYTWLFGNAAVPPGTVIPAQTFTVSLDLNDVQLLYARIKQGKIKLTAKSLVPRKLKFRYFIPLATLNGNQFEIVDEIAASIGADTAVYTRELDATGYGLDLRGPNQTQVNRLDIMIEVTLDPDGDTLNLASNQFLFQIRNEFTGITPAYGKGYLGQYAFQSGTSEVDLDVMNNFRSGYVDIYGVTLDIQMINRMGADVRFRPQLLEAVNERTGASLQLNHPAIGSTININRATETGIFSNPVSASYYTLHFDGANSNLEQLIELLPNKLNIDASMFLNPMGNVSGYEDFYFYDYPSLVAIDLVAPLKFAVNDVLFVDTLSNFLFDQEQLDHVASGEVKVMAENKFPLNALLQVYTLDAQGAITDSLFANQQISAAPVNGAGRVVTPLTSTVNLIVSETNLQHLKQADRLMLKAFFVTLPSAQLLQMYEDYYLKVKLIGDIRYNIEL